MTKLNILLAAATIAATSFISTSTNLIKSALAAQSALICTRNPNGMVNLREGPGVQYDIIASLPNETLVYVGGVVSVDSLGNEWFSVQVDSLNHASGYVRSDYVCG